MRRILMTLVVVAVCALALSFAGCSSEEETKSSSGTPVHPVFSTGVGMIGSPTLIYLDLDYTKYGDNVAQLSPIADISYGGLTLHPGNNARFCVLGNVDFDAVTYDLVAATPLSGADLAYSAFSVGTVAVYRTSMGHYGKFKVTSFRTDGALVMDIVTWA